MKRLLWCLALCSLCTWTVVGCGDDEAPGTTNEDGGVSNDDLTQIENDIDGINDSLTGLTGDVNDLNDELDGLGGDLTDLGDDLGGRLDALENPEILSCSAEDKCIPDGVEMIQTRFADIIDVVCDHEVDCCEEQELALKFGPGVDSKEKCVSLFTDIVNNGGAPNFESEAPYVIYQMILIAQVLNDPDVDVEVDADAVDACVESLRDHECPEYTESEPSEPECYVPTEYEQDPCSIWALLIGHQAEGEVCGTYSDYWEMFPECEEGTYCSFDGNIDESYSPEGICSKLPEEHDSCFYDSDCDPISSESWSDPRHTFLYCNQETAECTKLGDVGDPCAFIDPTFTYGQVPPYNGNGSLSEDCMPNLTCDPLTLTCIAPCEENRFCSPGNEISQCPADFVCNVTEIPALYDTFGWGICTHAIDSGDLCTLFSGPYAGSECASGSCGFFDDDEETSECADELIDAGDECGNADPDPIPGSDLTCEFSWCGTDGNCASPCNCEGDDCDTYVDEWGHEPTECGDGFYCDWGSYIGNGWYPCEEKIANTDPCDLNNNDIHAGCTSGFCDGANCAAKVTGTDAACATGFDEQCPNGQYCNANMICKRYVTAGNSCDMEDASGLQCDPALVCVDGATDLCQAKAGTGDPCNASNIAQPMCEQGLDCIDIDGPGPGSVSECYSYAEGTLAVDVYCSGVDSYCATGWCPPNSTMTSYNCKEKIAEGEDCDSADQMLDTCEDGLFCNHPADDTAGKCAKQKLPGQACKPYFLGLDCLNGYNGLCTLSHDRFICSYGAQPLETLFCDGN